MDNKKLLDKWLDQEINDIRVRVTNLLFDDSPSSINTNIEELVSVEINVDVRRKDFQNLVKSLEVKNEE